MNARNLTDLVDSNIHDCGSQLFQLETELTSHRPAGRLLPRCLQRTAQQCTPSLAHFSYHPSQLCGVWNIGVLHSKYPCNEAALIVKSPGEGHDSWWIDDIFCPESRQRWTNTKEWIRAQRERNVTVWIACYERTEGHRAALLLGVDWYVHIPAQGIRMRTDLAARQTNTSKAIFTAKNPRGIWIGLVKTEISHSEHHTFNNEWLRVLGGRYTTEWACSEDIGTETHAGDDRVTMIDWTSSLGAGMEDNALLHSQRWLHRRHHAIYNAPNGWRVWPSASSATMTWASDLSHNKTKATKLHNMTLEAIWEANRSHWAQTCEATAKAIQASTSAGLETNAL